MSRRVWVGIVAGVLAAGVIVSVGLGAYKAGQRSEVVTRTVGDGEVVRVVDGHGWGFGPGPGFFLFPLLAVVLIVLLLRGGRHWYGGWSRGEAPGPCGPGGPESAFEEWHRRAHRTGDVPTGPSAPAS